MFIGSCKVEGGCMGGRGTILYTSHLHLTALNSLYFVAALNLVYNW
jgi:hypothetical protein